MKRVLVPWLFALPLAACGGSDTQTEATGLTGEPAEVFSGAPLAELSDGECPKMANPGTRSFSSAGIEREVILHFPASRPENMPVMFFWHGLGDSAANISNVMRLEDFANDNEMVVVVPQSDDPFLITWDIFSGGIDATLYDDMRTCLANELNVDLNRIHTSGFSFGGLFSTRLILDRADTLASAVVFSGGTDAALGLEYSTPAKDVPVALFWGGEADTFDAGMIQVDFQSAAEDFKANLDADGHVTVGCDHGLGHTIPFDAGDVLTPWVTQHHYDQGSPFASDIAGFPDYCAQ